MLPGASFASSTQTIEDMLIWFQCVTVLDAEGAAPYVCKRQFAIACRYRFEVGNCFQIKTKKTQNKK